MDFQDYVAAIGRARRGAVHGGAAPPGPDNVVLLATTVSTSDVARGVAADFESEGLDLEAMLVLALAQTGGRGRHGRSWTSPPGRGVYATLARVYMHVGQLPALPLLVGVGLCRALAPWLPAGCRLKWPNDLVVPRGGGASGAGAGTGDAAAGAGSPTGTGAAVGAGSAVGAGAATGTGSAVGAGSPAWAKIGGVLIEALVRPANPAVALIGFGVNHSHRAADLPPGATSVALEAAAAEGGSAPSALAAAGDVDLAGLAELTWALVTGVERELVHADNLAYAVAAYRELSVHRPGDRLVCSVGADRKVAGQFGGFDDSGRLRLLHAVEVSAGGEPAAAAAGEAGQEMLLAAGEVIAG